MKPSHVRASIKHCAAHHQPLFIWGPPGGGKSDIVAQAATEMGRELRDVRLSLLDPVDLKGFPVPDQVNGVMTWLPPDFLPPMMVPGKPVKNKPTMVPNSSAGILFLDELTSALPAIQGAAYQLILNRKIGNYTLPENWDIVAAGNREGDRSIVHRMPAALRNRFVHLEFEVNLDEWCAWAIDHGITHELIAFLRFRSSLLHAFDPKSDPRAFPTPRTWAFANKIVKSQLPADVELELLKGTVGDGAAGEFIAFMRVVRNLPSVDQILVDPENTKVPEDLSAKYAISTALATRACRDNMDVLMKYAARLPIEFQVVFARDAGRRDNDVVKSSAFTKWAIKHSDILTN